jgi:hypothetical protein
MRRRGERFIERFLRHQGVEREGKARRDRELDSDATAGVEDNDMSPESSMRVAEHGGNVAVDGDRREAQRKVFDGALWCGLGTTRRGGKWQSTSRRGKRCTRAPARRLLPERQTGCRIAPPLGAAALALSTASVRPPLAVALSRDGYRALAGRVEAQSYSLICHPKGPNSRSAHAGQNIRTSASCSSLSSSPAR